MTTNTVDRKALAHALAAHLGTEARYMGVPSCAYRVGDYIINKNGFIEGNLEAMADATEAANASGKNMDLVNRTLAELATVGINIKATDLPDYLRGVAKGAQYGTSNLGSMTNRLTQMNREVAEAKEESADFTALIAEQGQYLSWGDYAQQAAGLRALTRELTAEEQAYLDAYDSYRKALGEAAAYDNRINGSRFNKESAQTTAETNVERTISNASKYRKLNLRLFSGVAG